MHVKHDAEGVIVQNVGRLLCVLLSRCDHEIKCRTQGCIVNKSKVNVRKPVGSAPEFPRSSFKIMVQWHDFRSSAVHIDVSTCLSISLLGSLMSASELKTRPFSRAVENRSRSRDRKRSLLSTGFPSGRSQKESNQIRSYNHLHITHKCNTPGNIYVP